jgi:hypothetical protein
MQEIAWMIENNCDMNRALSEPLVDRMKFLEFKVLLLGHLIFLGFFQTWIQVRALITPFKKMEMEIRIPLPCLLLPGSCGF